MALEQERCDRKPSCLGLRNLWASTKSEARMFRHDVHSLESKGESDGSVIGEIKQIVLFV